MRSGFESLRDLLFNDEYAASETIANIRKLIVTHNFGQWLNSVRTIDLLIKQARGKIIDRLFGQALPMESPHRPIDCSLAFISTSTISFDDAVISDVLLHFQLLNVLEEHLVRANGIVRYAPFELTMEDGHKEPVFDSYLADNYWLLPELRLHISGLSPETSAQRHFGSSDCSSQDAYLMRVKTARACTEAQWCFVSVIAEAYCRQVQKLQKSQQDQKLQKLQQDQKLQKLQQDQNLQKLQQDRSLQKENESGKDQEKTEADIAEDDLAKLITFGIHKAGEYLNRSFARITAAGSVKANGRDCPAWAIPEAYECVSPVGALSRTHCGAVAGANTPLAWGQASLFSASTLFRQILTNGSGAV
jgi:hypothetical protein